VEIAGEVRWILVGRQSGWNARMPVVTPNRSDYMYAMNYELRGGLM